MQLIHFWPVVEREKSPSSQVISEALVVNELGSDGSRLLESIHRDAQGEFGVARSDDTVWEKRSARSRGEQRREAIFAIIARIQGHQRAPGADGDRRLTEAFKTELGNQKLSQAHVGRERQSIAP